MPPEERFASLPDLRLHYLDWGGGVPPLVCLHGAGGNARNWEVVGAALQGQFRVIALDQRGHGQSDSPATGYEPTSLAADLLAFADALGLERFNLLGHSMGARAAIAFGGLYSHRLLRLVLSDPPHYPVEDDLVRELAAAPNRPERFPSRQAASDYLRRTLPDGASLADQELEARLSAQMREEPDGSYTWRLDVAGLLQAMTFLLGDMRWFFPRIAVPTLVLHGVRSHLLSVDDARRTAAAIPNATLVQIPDAGHGIYRDNPQAFLAAVRGFLSA
jgi:pimeloyl-ACP methyl ester carboxylesterase